MHLRTVNNKFSAAKIAVELVKGKDYLYFIFDDGKRYNTRSVMTPRLNDLPLEFWIREGEDFAREMTNV